MVNNMKPGYYLKYWLPVIVYMGLIFYLSSLSNPVKTLTPKGLDVYFDLPHFFYHIFEYMILSFLLFRALKVNSKYPQSLAIIITITYAITDELHQSFVSGRISSLLDILLDSFGAIAMQSIINFYNYLKD